MVLEGEDGKVLSRLPFTASGSRFVLKRCREQNCNPVDLFKGALEDCVGVILHPSNLAEDQQTGSAAPVPPQPSRSSGPGGDYAEMVAERCAIMTSQTDKYVDDLWLNLPGLLHGRHSTQELFAYAMRVVYFEAKKIRSDLFPHLGSDWELVDLEQLICIGDTAASNHSEHLPTGKNDPVKVYRRESQCLPMLTEHTLAAVTAFGAYTLHWFAPAISRWVLPKLELTDAVMLAEALVIAERVTGMFSGESGGQSREVGKLTTLERQACELTARLWREWPEDLDFGEVLANANPKPSYLERRRAAMESAPNVAA